MISPVAVMPPVTAIAPPILPPLVDNVLVTVVPLTLIPVPATGLAAFAFVVASVAAVLIA